MGRIILGIAGILFGVTVIVIGSLLLFAEQSIQLFTAEAEGRIPASLVFQAEEADYNVALRGSGISDNTIGNVRCDVIRSNESIKRLRGDAQNVSVQGGSVHSIGSFDATAGTTRVSCSWIDDSNRSVAFFVAKQRDTFRTFAFVVMGFGLVILLGSLYPLVRGAQSRSSF